MFVNPVYKLAPLTERIIEFRGLNKNPVVEEGELKDMKNMTSDEYPCLYQRKARGQYTMPGGIKKPISMICKNEKLGIIAEKDGIGESVYAFYYDGEEHPEVGAWAEDKGIPISEETKMVAINTKICFFPQKIYYSLIDTNNPVGNLDAAILFESATLTETGDGQIIQVQDTSYEEDAFLDFAIGDAINLNVHLEIIVEDEELSKDITTAALIQDIGFDGSTNLPFITVPSETFLELAEMGVDTASLSNIGIDKGCPDLDFVMEYNNRLWGVSNKDNTIYASKLGDPRNWQYFQNTSIDSYYAEQGTDGDWTGLAPYSGHMLFFKEQHIHKVYGTAPENYQIVIAKARGVEKGSSKSVAIVNDIVFYKSTLGIMAYEGDKPYLISQKFGATKFKDVVAGTDGVKYYCSLLKENNGVYEPYMLACDINKGLWHKEDELKVRDFCLLGDELLFINENKVDYFNSNNIYVINSKNPMSNEEMIKWMVEIGPFDEYIENKKVVSKLAMRLSPEEKSELDISISMDNGEYEYLEHIADYHESVLFVPIVPRRCNKFTIKLEGIGRCRVESLSRKYRVGTGGML